MLGAFLIPFATIALAEMGDKTQLLLLAFAARRCCFTAYIGAVLGFLCADAIGVIFGATALKWFSGDWLQFIAATTFLGFGVYALINAGKKEEVEVKASAFVSAFFLVGIAEMGDKSQIAAALFAAQYNPFLVFLGVTSALAVITIPSFLLAKQLAKVVKSSLIKAASGVLFIGIAIATYVSMVG